MSSDNIRFFDQIDSSYSNDSTIKQTLLFGNEYAFLENSTYHYAFKIEIRNCTEWQYSKIFNELLALILLKSLIIIYF